MGKYASMAATAQSLIGKKGTDVTFTRRTSANFDPITQHSDIETATFTMKAVGIPPGRSAEYRIGSIVNRNLIELHLAPNGGLVPAPGDSVSWAGVDWTVFWANALDPAGDGAPYCLAYAER